MRIELDENPGAVVEALVEKIEEQRAENNNIREANYGLQAENLTLRVMVAMQLPMRLGVGRNCLLRRN